MQQKYDKPWQKQEGACGASVVDDRSSKVLSTTLLPSLEVKAIFSTFVGVYYQLEKSIGLAPDSWTKYKFSFKATSRETICILPVDSLYGKEFFRLVVAES